MTSRIPHVVTALSLFLARRRSVRQLANWFRFVGDQASVYALKAQLKSCGKRGRIWSHVIIHSPEHVDLGDDVHLADFVHIWGAGGVHIGDRVMIGAHSCVSSVTHDYSACQPMIDTLVLKRVVIEDDVWIGSNVVVLPGVSIGSGAVVGAGAVVTKDVVSRVVVAGVPARVIKNRAMTKCISVADN